MEKEETCLLLRVKLPWLQAGIETLRDDNIKKKLKALQDEYNTMFRRRKEESVKASSNREEYTVKIKKTFNISKKDARNIIMNDPNRSEAAVKEDLAFFDDQLGSNNKRKMCLGKRDTGYDKDVLSSLLSAQALENRRQGRKRKQEAREEKEKQERVGRMQRSEDQNCNDGADGGSDGEDGDKRQREKEDDDDSDWVGCEEKKKKQRRSKRKGGGGGGGGGGDGDDDEDEDDFVWLRMPRDILKITSPTATRRGLSHGDHVSILAATITASGGDLDDFIISYATSYRHRKQAVAEVYATTREEFTQKVLAEDWPLTLHFDEKEMKDRIGPHRAGLEKKTPRLAVTITCPLLQGEFFVCGPSLENQSGRACAEAALAGVEELGVLDKVVAVDYDTTASNSSPVVGAAALIEQRRATLLFKVPCRHHITNLLGKNTAPVVSGRRSTGPGDPLFQRYAREWPDLVDNIDYANLKRFDDRPYIGTFIAAVVQEVRNWARHAVTAMTFTRATNKNLLYLIVMYLDVEPANFQFKFHKPEEIDNARFWQTANIYLTMELLSRQLAFLSPEHRLEVTNMAFISALFYGPCYLKSPLLASASFNDLTSIQHFRQLYRLMPEGNCLKDAAGVALNTWERHLDYLTGPHITWSLLNDDFSEEERQVLANALLARLDERVMDLPPSRVQYPGPALCRNEQIWPVDGSLPALDQFVTHESFLAFNVLELTDQEVRDFLQVASSVVHLEFWPGPSSAVQCSTIQVPVAQWSQDQNSATFQPVLAALKYYANNLESTNDPAERALKTMKDAITKYNLEENFQHGLVTIVEERKLAKASKNGSITKQNLKKIIRRPGNQ